MLVAAKFPFNDLIGSVRLLRSQFGQTDRTGNQVRDLKPGRVRRFFKKLDVEAIDPLAFVISAIANSSKLQFNRAVLLLSSSLENAMGHAVGLPAFRKKSVEPLDAELQTDFIGIVRGLVAIRA